MLLLRLIPAFDVEGAPLSDSLLRRILPAPEDEVGVVACLPGTPGPEPVGVGISAQEDCAWLTRRRAHLKKNFKKNLKIKAF